MKTTSFASRSVHPLLSIITVRKIYSHNAAELHLTSPFTV